ncbi:MAG: cation:proton antiporter [Candidatus Altiarchaeota archaeon]|nr:cation:proton antiporter [Candidatus Altiarchaeota archaeon]
MIGVEHTLMALLLILGLGLVIPEFFRNRRFPFSIFLLIFGALLGPFGLNYIQADSTIEFFGFLGSTFLMFMAGLEVKLDTLKRFGKDILIMAVSNGLVPFGVGLLISLMFGNSLITSLLIGTIFISSSVAIVSISLDATGLMHRKIGKAVLSATVIQDTVSLLLLSLILQYTSGTSDHHILTFSSILILSIVALKILVPFIAKRFLERGGKLKRESYEGELRFVLIALMLAALYFSSIGVHPIVASFIMGVLLSDIATSERIRQKLHTIGYGLFIPVFFFVVGMEINVGLVFGLDPHNLFTVAIIIGLIISKVLSGYLSGRVVGFSGLEASIFGVSSTVQLTTTLAAVYAANAVGLFDTVTTTSIILLSVFTTIVSPLLLSVMANKFKQIPADKL